MSATAEARPTVVAFLGYGGLLPLVAAAALCWFEPNHRSYWLQSLLGYGAVILSFVGALHWGFAMVHPGADRLNVGGVYTWSIVPALLGWAAVLASPGVGAGLLLAGLLAHYRQDLRLAKVLPLPGWYLALRLRLTAVASLCLASVFFLAPLLPAPALTA